MFGAVFHPHREQKCKEAVRGVLTRLVFNQAMKEKFRVFAKNGNNLVSLIRRIKYISRMKLLTVVIEFDRELSYLSWVFDKKLKGFKGPNSKGFKYYDSIY